MKSVTLPSAQDISAQLHRILRFPAFANSPILSQFLSFIVERSLAAEEHTLKEYTIGVNVLSKKHGYDPQADGAVRIHAGRLRRTLHAYYDGPGKADKVYISVPKGSYIPKFHRPSPSSIVSDKLSLPTLAIFPFSIEEDSALQSLADGLCDQICTEFGNFTELSVVSYYSSRKLSLQVSDSGDAAVLLDADYLLTGSIQSSSDQVRIRVQLVRSDTKRQVWSSTYNRSLSSFNTFLIQDDIVNHVVNQIAGSHGIVFRESAHIKSSKDILDLKVYDAIFWYYHMVNRQNEIVFEKALASTKAALQVDPLYAMGWAILGEIYVAGIFNGFDTKHQNPLQEAVRCGIEALRIDHRCHHGYQTLGLAYLFLHQKQECRKVVEQWTGLKSNAAAISGGLGFCLICIGEFDRGFAMIMESIQLNPYYPWWFNGGVSFYHFMRSEWLEAVYWAEKMHTTSEPWELILKIASYSEMRDNDRVNDCLTVLRERHGNIAANPVPYIGAFLQVPELVERLTAPFVDSKEVNYKESPSSSVDL